MFSDASFKNLGNKTGSAGGYIIFLSGGFIPGRKGWCIPLTWKSIRVKRVATSTYEAETLICSEAVEEAAILKHMMVKMSGIPEKIIAIECYTDCNDLSSAVHSSTQLKGGRVQVDIAKIREMLENCLLYTSDAADE